MSIVKDGSIRMNLGMTVMDAVVSMSENNPGALVCLMDMMNKDDWYANVPGIIMIMNLDSLGVYGEHLYMLWNDCCDRDLTKLELVLRNWQMGRLKKEAIWDNLSQGYGRPFDNLVPLDELFATT